MRNELSLLARTALPLIYGQFAFAANTFVTQLFLSHHSDTALRASLPGSMLAVTWMSFFNATLGYAGTICARHHGSGESRAALSTFVQSVWLAFASLPLLILGMPLARIILGLFNTSPEVLEAEVHYFNMLLPNGALTILATVLAGHFMGLGRTRFVGFATVAGFIVNMILSPVFIRGAVGLPGGVIGAAIAQTLAHVVPCLLLGARLWHEHPFRADGVPLRPALLGPAAREILRLGLPNGFRIVLEIAGFFVFTAFIAECDAAAVAASTMLFAVNAIPHGCVQALASAAEILMGRSLQDGQRERHIIHAAFLITALIAGFYLGTLVLVTLIHPQALQPANPTYSLEAFTTALWWLVAIVAVKTFVEFGTIILQGLRRGRGETAFVCRTQAIVSFLFWIPAYCLVRICHPTVPAFWMTMILSGAVSCTLLLRGLGTPARSRA